MTDDHEVATVSGVLGVMDAARGVLADLDLDAVLERLVQAARELTGARYAALGVLDRSRSELERFITVGVDDETHRGIGALPRGRGVLGELISDPRPLRLADVGAHPRSYGFPPGHPDMSSFLGVPVLVAGKPFGNLYLTEKSGREKFTEEDEQAVVRLADLAGVAIDHAQRYGNAEAQRSELKRTVEALDATVQIARAVGGETNLDVVLGLVAKRGRALVSARALVIERQQGGEMVVAAGAGELPNGLVGRAVDLHESVASAALRSLRTFRVEEEPYLARFDLHGLGRLGAPASAGRGRHRLGPTEQERARWARELHDETLQSLASLRLSLSAQLRQPEFEPAIEAIHDAVGQLETEIANLRSLIAELRPAALDDLGAEQAIKDLAGRRLDAHRMTGRGAAQTVTSRRVQ